MTDNQGPSVTQSLYVQKVCQFWRGLRCSLQCGHDALTDLSYARQHLFGCSVTVNGGFFRGEVC